MRKFHRLQDSVTSMALNYYLQSTSVNHQGLQLRYKYKNCRYNLGSLILQHSSGSLSVVQEAIGIQLGNDASKVDWHSDSTEL
jgi:hypothetical protein